MNERDRVFQVSSNRGRGRHRVRYVEGSASEPGECRLCVGSLADQPEILFFRLPHDQDPRALLTQI
ncbi:acetyltransferase [Alcanivorax nanhaiticus]|uniref:Acetyltransferase n=1 Tax=Alcanivorax nanhaiticus TaxID=1177154 RepID=A0A095SHR3_9GAMM|nr:hypothetical protein [Alcanivorax nanhaiticus]KGD63899.1 acetyltransferase [Alcanivorax nanhaiticus]